MTSKKLLPLFVFSFLLSLISLQGQQLSLFTQYRENATLINPAAMESDFLAYGYNLSIGASYRKQWVGLSGSPVTQTIRASYINTNISGVTILAGGHLINDQTGPTGFTGLSGRIGGVISSDPEYSGLSIAISGGIMQYRVDSDEIVLRDEGDVIGTTDQTQLFPDVGFGIYYYQMLDGGGALDGDMFYAGVSVPQALGLDLTFKDENGEFLVQRVQHFYGMLGLYKFIDDESFIQPSVWVKYTQGAPVNADFNLKYQMPGSFWIGSGLSSAKNFHAEAGFALGESVGFDNLMKIGYGFDYSFSSFGPSSGSTHEINLTISFDK